MSSEHRVEVVRVGKVERHPNADSLSVTMVHGGYPVCFRTGEYQEGDLAVYVPVDSIVPAGDPRWDFLQGHLRIRAKKLRGLFSMGLLTPLPVPVDGSSLAKEGDDLSEVLRIVAYEPTIHLENHGVDEANLVHLKYDQISSPFEEPVSVEIVIAPFSEAVSYQRMTAANLRCPRGPPYYWKPHLRCSTCGERGHRKKKCPSPKAALR